MACEKLTHSNRFSWMVYSVSCCRLKVDQGAVMMESDHLKELTVTIFQAITLAMGVAVVVLSLMGNLSEEKGIVLLGIGVISSAVAMINRRCIWVRKLL